MLLVAASISELQRLFNNCERELEWLDMRINVKKIPLPANWSYRFNISCARITTSDGHSIPWVEERYAGVHIVAGRQFKCSLTHAKQSFYRSNQCHFW